MDDTRPPPTPPQPPAAAALLPALDRPHDGEAIAFGDATLSYGELARLAGSVAARVAGMARVAVWAMPAAETAVAVTGALAAGVAAVPLNPRAGARECSHVLNDSEPDAVLAADGAALPEALAGVERIPVRLDDTGTGAMPLHPDPDAAAFVMYTSGTTGPPKGALVTRRAVAADLDALAAVWDWGPDDVLAHALPLFHVHGLILGVLGPLRTGGTLHHVGRFTAEAVAAELASGATMLFGVPTMYHRLAAAATSDRGVAAALARARLLVSGSAGLGRGDHERIREVSGRGVVERYGMTETLITCAVPAADPDAEGTVGPPLPGVDLRLVDDSGEVVDSAGEVGEIQVRGDVLYDGYLNRPDATAAATTPDGWFRTGDAATRRSDGYVSIVGRRATDLIKSGGFKIGAGEIEDVLLEHPGVAEAAVTGVADADLGERVEAWVVTTPGHGADLSDLAGHVAAQLAPHKRPRAIHRVESLPRNEMGKVLKGELG